MSARDRLRSVLENLFQPGPVMKPGAAPRVAVTIVTFNSERYIAHCLEHLFELTYPNFEVILIDNASTDGSASILRQYASRATVVYNSRNRGFAGGQNQAIAL